MSSLVGTIFQPGTIEFLHRNNKWAFDRMQSESSADQIPRVVFDPKKLSIELELSENVAPEEIPWVDHVLKLLLTADQVFLKPEHEKLRFQQAVHELGKRRQLITLGNQSDVNEFAKRSWQNIRYLYANRRTDFQFNISTIISHRDGEAILPNKVELKSRMFHVDDEPLPHVVFDATGSDAPMEIVAWRKSTEENRECRFAPEDSRIELRVAVHKQPLSFIHEYREEFNNHAYIFEGDTMNANLKKIAKRQGDCSSE